MPVFIDLALDDESLKLGFEVWLAGARSRAKERDFDPVAFRKIDEKTLSEWHERRLLAAYDLVSWREITGATYSDAAIASWLWPDSGVLADGSVAFP